MKARRPRRMKSLQAHRGGTEQGFGQANDVDDRRASHVRVSRASTFEHGDDPRLHAALSAFLQLVDGRGDGGGVHLMHLETLPDAAQQRDGEPAAEMFSELLQPAQHQQRAFGIEMLQFVGVNLKFQFFDQAQDAFGCARLEETHAP